MLICILCVVHLARYPPAGQDYLGYLMGSFDRGVQERIGCGIFAGMFVYPIQYTFFGDGRGYIFYIAIDLVCVTLISVSPSRMWGDRVNERVKTARLQRAQEHARKNPSIPPRNRASGFRGHAGAGGPAARCAPGLRWINPT